MTRPSLHQCVLDSMPGTRRDITRKSGVSKSGVFRHIQILRDAGKCHIADWQKQEGGGDYMPVFAAGPGKDVECKFKPMSDLVSQRRFRKKARASGAWDDRAARIRAKYWADKAVKTPQTWLGPLLGVAHG